MTGTHAAKPAFNDKTIIAFVLVWFFFPAALVIGYIASQEMYERGERGRGLLNATMILAWLPLALLATWLWHSAWMPVTYTPGHI